VFAVWSHIDSHAHILIFTEIALSYLRVLKRFYDGNALFFDGFYRRRELFRVGEQGEKGEE
jgi:hypothetical protein